METDMKFLEDCLRKFIIETIIHDVRMGGRLTTVAKTYGLSQRLRCKKL